jgi:predicted dithiol-disulfide oxidoreductase (DUF899 family)
MASVEPDVKQDYHREHPLPSDAVPERAEDEVAERTHEECRGDEAMGSTWAYLGITAPGRQEDWEDSPEGYPQSAPYQWWHRHDEYSA